MSGRGPPRRGGLATHVAKQLPHGLLQVLAVDDGVNHSVLEQELGCLEAFGKILADRLLDDPRSCKADDRTRLSENRVAEHRVARAHPTRCWICENRHIWYPPLGELRKDCSSLCHLHET